MWQGRTRDLAKLWESISGRQIGSIPSGTNVTGDAPRSDGYTLIRSPQMGYTKTMWLSPYTAVPPNPPPPPPPPPPTATLTHVIDIYDDGSVFVDGNPVP